MGAGRVNINSDLCHSLEGARSSSRGETAVRRRGGTGGSALEHGSLACLHKSKLYYYYEDEHYTIKSSLMPIPSYQSEEIYVFKTPKLLIFFILIVLVLKTFSLFLHDLDCSGTSISPT